MEALKEFVVILLVIIPGVSFCTGLIYLVKTVHTIDYREKCEYYFHKMITFYVLSAVTFFILWFILLVICLITG